MDPNAPIEITAYSSAPQPARGRVKDLRIRWALEEIGLPYRVRLIGDVFADKPQGYLTDQPFGQVPVYKDDGLTLFESGAILIHIGAKDERLLPRDTVGHGRAISWTFAALNSIEPMMQTLFLLGFVAEGKDWQDAAKDAVRPFAEKRLAQLSRTLDDREWLEDQFTIGDLMMIDVLRTAPEPQLITAHPNLAAYVERGTSRSAFKAAMAAQLDDFEAVGPPEQVRGERA